MMIDGLVSIIVPLYNSEEFIGETIESVLKQTYTKWELLIVDDCSTDDSRKIVNSYCKTDNRILLIESEVNAGGPARPRNMGMKKAKGEFIAFLDSDDIWFPNKLKIQVDLLNNRHEIILLGTNAETFPQRFKNKLYLNKDLSVSFQKLITSNKLITSSVIIRSEIISKIGFFDEQLKATEDYDYWLRILNYKNNSALVLSSPLLKYRLHNHNLSLYSDKTKKGHYDYILDIYKKYPTCFSSEKLIFLEENKEYLNQLLGVKEAYHRDQLTTWQVLTEHKIKVIDKILLVLKKPVLNYLKGKV